MSPISRRKLLTGGAVTVAGVAGLAAADRIARRHGLIPPDCGGIYGPGETLTYAAQRLMTRHAMAREFPRGMISKMPFMNETPKPSEEYLRHQANGFRDWRLVVEGMVEHPLSLSVPELQMMAKRSQITEVVCEEGWSYVAEWIGTPLSAVLQEAGLKPGVRYIAYFTTSKELWGSIDMGDALHPQTLLSWGMNDGDLPVGFGGPLRMRVPRQLGYKSLKYVNRLIATDSMKKFGKGLGSVDPEYGYAWYAGI
jgi:DMSO/TMAO reductase YedYZ molybdopterin-dependent catalytic subunit